MPYCERCLGEVESLALRCRHCGAAFRGPDAVGRLDPKAEPSEPDELGVTRTGIDFSLEPESD